MDDDKINDAKRPVDLEQLPDEGVNVAKFQTESSLEAAISMLAESKRDLEDVLARFR